MKTVKNPALFIISHYRKHIKNRSNSKIDQMVPLQTKMNRGIFVFKEIRYCSDGIGSSPVTYHSPVAPDSAFALQLISMAQMQLPSVSWALVGFPSAL